MCDAKQMKFQDAVENPPHTQMPGMSDPSGQTDMLVQQLFDLEGEEVSAPDVDILELPLECNSKVPELIQMEMFKKFLLELSLMKSQ
jgi:hypothetical protein